MVMEYLGTDSLSLQKITKAEKTSNASESSFAEAIKELDKLR